MLVRCYRQPDGSVRIVTPNPKHRLPVETETAFLDRICKGGRGVLGAEVGDPTLRGSTVDMDSSLLPPKSRRHAWRLLSNATVVTDDRTIPDRLPAP